MDRLHLAVASLALSSYLFAAVVLVVDSLRLVKHSYTFENGDEVVGIRRLHVALVGIH